MTADVVAACRQAIERLRTDGQEVAGKPVLGPLPYVEQALRFVPAALDAFTAILDEHEPKRDDPMSMVQHTYCGCGAMKPFLAADGLVSIGPVPFPCRSVQIVAGALGVGQETP